jgi:hypothetical protein
VRIRGLLPGGILGALLVCFLFDLENAGKNKDFRLGRQTAFETMQDGRGAPKKQGRE